MDFNKAWHSVEFVEDGRSWFNARSDAMGNGRSCVPSTARGLAEVGTGEEANVKQPRGK